MAQASTQYVVYKATEIRAGECIGTLDVLQWDYPDRIIPQTTLTHFTLMTRAEAKAILASDRATPWQRKAAMEVLKFD